MKALVINADDLGLSDSVNGAVSRLYEMSAITGSSIMPAGRRFSEASAMLKEKGVREAGVHLTLTGSSHPLTGGSFLPGYPTFFAGYYSGRIDLRKIKEEIFAQVQKTAGEKFDITHIDSHEHVHMLPGVLEAAIEAATQFNIPYIRVPLEDPVVRKNDFSAKDLLRYAALRYFAGRARKAVSAAGLATCDMFLGHFHAGRINGKTLGFFADNMKEGVTELAVHPALMSRELMEDSPWHRNGQIEMEALLSDGWKEKLEKRGVKLLTHREAAGAR